MLCLYDTLPATFWNMLELSLALSACLPKVTCSSAMNDSISSEVKD